MKSVIFITGLGGTGKSSVMYYFLENPVKGFSFYDFDKGLYKPPLHEEDHLAWRTKQNDWWLFVAHKEYEVRGNVPVIVGLTLYPRQVIELPNAKYFDKKNIKFGLLTAEHETRRDRLISRGTPHHWKGIIPWYEIFFKEMEGHTSFSIDSTDKTIEDVSNAVYKEIVKLI